VKSGAPSCPFCEAPLAGAELPDGAPDTRGWKRAAIFSFGLAVAGCGSTTTSTSGDAAPDTVSDTGTDVTTDRPAETGADVLGDVPADDNGGVAPPYGIAPKDAGVPADDGSFKADYGAPPPPDASTDR
jgi:hypothetical protein